MNEDLDRRCVALARIDVNVKVNHLEDAKAEIYAAALGRGLLIRRFSVDKSVEHDGEWLLRGYLDETVGSAAE